MTNEKQHHIKDLAARRALQGDLSAGKEIRARADRIGIYFDSIFKLYEEIAQERIGGFTIPAINIRTLTFDIASQIFRVMRELNVGPVIFELARSEIGYTNQPIDEYATVVLAAALAEKYRGPVFVQADHFQVTAKKYFASEPEKAQELDALSALVLQAIKAGVYNIDIDASTLVRLEKKTLSEQQRHNCEVTGLFAQLIRKHQPKGITVAIGGEVGEVGGKNSTPEEVEELVRGVRAYLNGSYPDLSKISVQTGTSHGGVVGADGRLLQVRIDFEALRQCSEKARELGLAGVVQHGASTLPTELFDRFPKAGCIEIHLATEFQNIVYKHLPDDLRESMYQYCWGNFYAERKEKDTDEQFIYKTRKKALGPFKREIWELPEEIKAPMMAELADKFTLLFEKLKVSGTWHIVDKLYRR